MSIELLLTIHTQHLKNLSTHIHTSSPHLHYHKDHVAFQKEGTKSVNVDCHDASAHLVYMAMIIAQPHRSHRTHFNSSSSNSSSSSMYLWQSNKAHSSCKYLFSVQTSEFLSPRVLCIATNFHRGMIGLCLSLANRTQPLANR